MVVQVFDRLSGCNTHAQGDELRAILADALTQKRPLVLSFLDVPAVTSSFVNAAFVDLLGQYSFDEIKRIISIHDANRQISDMIRGRMRTEADRLAPAA